MGKRNSQVPILQPQSIGRIREQNKHLAYHDHTVPDSVSISYRNMSAIRLWCVPSWHNPWSRSGPITSIWPLLGKEKGYACKVVTWTLTTQWRGNFYRESSPLIAEFNMRISKLNEAIKSEILLEVLVTCVNNSKARYYGSEQRRGRLFLER